MSKKIPKFKTEDEEHEFWDTHDSIDFIDQTEAVEPIEFIRKPAKIGVLRLDLKLLEDWKDGRMEGKIGRLEELVLERSEGMEGWKVRLEKQERKLSMEKKIFISYDKEADVMYLSFDESAKAEAEEIEDGVFARYEHQTKELVGLTITNFSQKFAMKPTEVVVPIYV